MGSGTATSGAAPSLNPPGMQRGQWGEWVWLGEGVG